jgi:integrase
VARRWLVPHLGGLELRAITPASVDDLVGAMREDLAPATVRTNYGVLRAIMARAVDRELIARSPCRGIDMPAPTARPPRFLSVDELHRLAETTPVEYRQMIYLGGVVGLRWSEVAGLRVGRVDFLGRSVTVAETLAEVEGRVMFAEPKSRASHRTVGLPAALVDSLAEHLARRGRAQAR